MNHTINEKGILSQCFTFSHGQQLTIDLPEKRRLSGIGMSSWTSRPDIYLFERANSSFFGGEENITIGHGRKTINDSASLFAFANVTGELSSVRIVNLRGFRLCHLEIFSFPDECGHFEVPIHHFTSGTTTRPCPFTSLCVLSCFNWRPWYEQFVVSINDVSKWRIAILIAARQCEMWSPRCTRTSRGFSFWWPTRRLEFLVFMSVHLGQMSW